MPVPAHRQVIVEPPKDGFEVGAFVVTQDAAWADVDWTDAKGWLVARWQDRIVGAIQVLYGRPVGRIDMLFVPETLGDIQRSVVVFSLWNTAAEYLREAGVEVALGMISDELKAFGDVVEKRGLQVVDRGRMIFWRLSNEDVSHVE